MSGLPRVDEGELPKSVQGDTWANTVELEYSDSGNPIDLTGTTLEVHVGPKHGDYTVYEKTLTVDDAAKGIASWEFTETETEDLEGLYEVRLIFTDSVGNSQTLFIAEKRFVSDQDPQT